MSAPLESMYRLYMTEASTLAGENVLGSFNNEIMLIITVLFENVDILSIEIV